MQNIKDYWPPVYLIPWINIVIKNLKSDQFEWMETRLFIYIMTTDALNVNGSRRESRLDI